MTTLRIQTESVPVTVQIPATTPMSNADFQEFCLANRDLRIERTAEGEVIIMPPTHADTGNRNFNLAVQLGNWAEQDGTGICFDSSAGFTLPNGATRSPDVSWLKLERWDSLTAEEKASFAPICPDFVVELQSASDSLNTSQEKMQEYIDNGTSLGWLIDRQQRQVWVYRRDQVPKLLNDPEVVRGESELPGFALRMAKIW